jgi:hypothetical protein
LAALLPVAQELRQRGYRCVLALRNIHQAQAWLLKDGAAPFEVIQAPVNWIDSRLSTPALSHADVLFKSAYGNAQELQNLIVAWQHIFRQFKPAAVILETAPTAQLACWAEGIASITTGTGFSVPPHSGLWSSFPSKKLVDRALLLESENSLLRNINQALSALTSSPINSLAALYPKESSLVGSVPELDHYAREEWHYVGPPELASSGATPFWSVKHGLADKGPEPAKVFAYLQASYAGLVQLLNVLEHLPIQVAAYIPNLSRAEKKYFERANVWLSDVPLNARQAINESVLTICHGGTLAQSSCLAGKPVFLLPNHTEQSMMAAKIRTLGLGLDAFATNAAEYKRLLIDLLRNDKYTKSAIEFAERNKQFLGNFAALAVADAAEAACNTEI